MDLRLNTAAAIDAAERRLTLEQLRAEPPTDGVKIALDLPNHVDVEDLADDLSRVHAVVLNFPKWTDGRAYTQARLLRARLRFAGEVRAVGDVVADMLPLLQRCGFDAVWLRDGQRVEVAQHVLGFFSSFYQGDVHETRPVFGREAV